MTETGTATPADWMDFGTKLGWSIDSRPAPDKCAFVMKSGLRVWMSDEMRLDIIKSLSGTEWEG